MASLSLAPSVQVNAGLPACHSRRVVPREKDFFCAHSSVALPAPPIRW